ncbi:MAG: nucleotidyltransferase domain-containing protein, partial [Planctomycetota bacterium JB042]
SMSLPGPSDHWRWRQDVVEAMAAALDPERFGVARLFVGGSTESGHAGPGSDIDVFVVCEPGARRDELALWLDGWSRCLAELCRRQTGVAFEGGVLDVRWLSEVPDLRRRPDLRELPLARRDEGEAG